MKNTISVILFGLLLFCQSAWALDLHTAKAQGLVGETTSGYLAPVNQAPEVLQLVEEINTKRRLEYQEIAQRNNTPLAAVEERAGKLAIEKTLPGQLININGTWQKK